MARQSLIFPTLFVVAACGEDHSAPAPNTAPAQPRVIALRDAAGAVTLELSVTPERCTVTGVTDLAVVRQDQATIATMGTTAIMTLGPGPAGQQLTDPDGTARMRVVDQPERLDLVQTDGVPVAAIIAASGRAQLVDGARSRVLEVAPDGDHLAVTGVDVETVTGTDDLVLAAVLAFQGVPPDVRALLACARALPAAPAAPDLP